jgi:hypothetical protein
MQPESTFAPGTKGKAYGKDVIVTKYTGTDNGWQLLEKEDGWNATGREVREFTDLDCSKKYWWLTDKASFVPDVKKPMIGERWLFKKSFVLEVTENSVDGSIRGLVVQSMSSLFDIDEIQWDTSNAVKAYYTYLEGQYKP